MATNWIATADKGDEGQPGGNYCKQWAGVMLTPSGQYELHVRHVWGSNQGYLEEHGRIERRYRADTLEEVMQIGIEQIRADEEFEEAGPFVAAIRDAVYDAMDHVIDEV